MTLLRGRGYIVRSTLYKVREESDYFKSTRFVATRFGQVLLQPHALSGFSKTCPNPSLLFNPVR